MLYEFHQEIILLGLLVVLLSAPPVGTAGGVPSATPGSPREPNWKKYLKYLAWLLLATLLGFAFLYAVGETSAGDDPPGTSPAPWTPPGLPNELFDRRSGWSADQWADQFVGTTEQDVRAGVERVVNLKSNRVLKSEVVQRLGNILRVPLDDRADLPWYVRQRMIETAPAETDRAMEVVRESLDNRRSLRESYRDGLVAVEKRHGTRLYEFAREYKQKR